MYLVLTAMLALNVSADIVNGFNKLRISMNDSMIGTKLRTEDAMEVFEAAYQAGQKAIEGREDGVNKYADWYVIAKAVRDSADGFYNYIETFKMDITRMVAGSDTITVTPRSLKGGDDTNKPHQYAMAGDDPESWRATELKKHMDDFRCYVTVVDSKCILDKLESSTKFKHNWEQRVSMMNGFFSTDSLPDLEGKMQSWQESTFAEMPAAAVLALLTKYQNDVRVAENDLINFLFASAGQSDFAVNEVVPVVVPISGDYVMSGQTYQARIVSAMMDTNQRPRVFIDGKELDQDGYYEAKSGIGEHTYDVKMLVMVDDKEREFTTQGKYTVGAASAALSNKDLNIMYVGWDNMFTVAVPGAKKVQLVPTGATCEQKGSEYLLKPTGGPGSKATIQVKADYGSGMVNVGTPFEYRVKKLPTPSAFFTPAGKDPKNAGDLSPKDYTNTGSKIEVSYGADGILPAKFRVVSFSVILPSGMPVDNQGDKITAKTAAQIKGFKKGQYITFTNIKAVGPDGKPATGIGGISFKSL